VLTLRRSEDRGRGEHGWLDSRHTFSFADYYDPRFAGFHDLLVINEDRVAPGKGFGTHRHKEMEIISYVLEGAIEHKDSTGTGEVLRPGEVQRMSAGTGIAHSESNPSKTESLHFLQIWIVPGTFELPPSYEQKAYPATERANRLRLIGSRDGRDGSVTIHQDVDLYTSSLAQAASVVATLRPGRVAWLQVARGSIDVRGKADAVSLTSGDGLAIVGEDAVEITGKQDAEFLLFDLRDSAETRPVGRP
jgi:redox-sensitive bicupin YhaK (pirin superfamily)